MLPFTIWKIQKLLKVHSCLQAFDETKAKVVSKWLKDNGAEGVLSLLDGCREVERVALRVRVKGTSKKTGGPGSWWWLAAAFVVGAMALKIGNGRFW